MFLLTVLPLLDSLQKAVPMMLAKLESGSEEEEEEVPERIWRCCRRSY